MRTSVRDSYFRTSRPPHRDTSQGLAFFAVILVFALVAVVLFFGNSWGIVPSIASANIGTVANARLVVPPPPTPAPSPVNQPLKPRPALLAAVLQPVPTLTPVAAATATAATATPTVVTPTVVSPVVLDSLASPLGLPVGHVANTGGQGVFLRRTPQLSDRQIAWADKTPMVLLGNEADGDGQHWLQVRDPRANVGWIPAQYIAQ